MVTRESSRSRRGGPWRRWAVAVSIALVAAVFPTVQVAAETVTRIDDVDLEQATVRSDPGARAWAAGADGSVEPFVAVALSWAGDLDATISVRYRTGGSWSAWQSIAAADDSPDGDELDRSQQELDGRVVSDPVWAGAADGFVVQAPDGVVGLRAHFARESTRRVARSAAEPAGAAPVEDGPKIRLRSSWGAAPSRRVSYAGMIKRVVVHHTATTNDYTAEDVPRILRSVQAFHQRTRGWDDIGYNFVVDRFGRIWEARQGGVDRPVIGGHTKGFNTGSVGIAVLGDHNAAAAPDAVVDAVGELAGWRLTIAGADPAGRTKARSFGNDRYRDGAIVEFPCITGHRDNKSTSCPGTHLYAALGRIRTIAAARFDHVFGAFERLARVPGGLLATGYTVDRSTIDPTSVALRVDGGPAVVVMAGEYRPDIEAAHPGAGTNRGFSVPIRVGAGPHVVCATGLDDAGISNADLGCQEMTVGPDPIGALDEAASSGGLATVRGWALDPDADDAVLVDVLADGEVVATVPATVDRPDIDAAHPGYGAAHGFEVTVGVSPSVVQLCVNARNVGPGTDIEVGCRVVGLPVDRFLVSLVPGAGARRALAAGSTFDDRVRVVRTVGSVLSVETDAVTAAELARLPGVGEVAPEPVYRAAVQSSDPCVVGCGSHRQTHLAAIGAPRAWSETTGRRGVSIAIIDSGVNPDGIDLAGRVDHLVDYTGDGTGADDDNSSGGHGTMVAGLAAGDGDNGVGGAGLAWNVGIRSYKVLDSNGSGYLTDIAQAIRDATDDGVDVINLSLTGDHTPTMESAVRYAHDHGVVVVAAAGNVNSSTTRNRYPAAYPTVIGVGSTNDLGAKAAFSNHSTCLSDDFVSLSAPGVDVTAIDRTDTPRSVDGTSFSAPMVSGVAALLRSLDPTMTVEQITRALTAGAVYGNNSDPRLGSGELSARRAVLQRSARLVDRPPVGLITEFARVDGAVRVRAFIADPDDHAPRCFRVAVGGTPQTFGLADTPAAALGRRGFEFTSVVPVGTTGSDVCVQVVDDAGAGVDVACRRTLAGTAPIGNFESLRPIPGGAMARLWTLDPETSDPITVDFTVDGAVATTITADAERPDVGAAFFGYGSHHGAAVEVPIPAGVHEVCAVARGVARTPLRTVLGCRSIDIDASTIGNLDLVQRVPGGLRVLGWSVDRGSADPVTVSLLTLDARGTLVATATTADAGRPDVGRAFPEFGSFHGFDQVVPADASTRRICASARNDHTAAFVVLGCRDLRLASDPMGNLESAVRTGPTSVQLAGWALDPDTGGSIEIHLYGDGRFAGVLSADGVRHDVAAAFPGYPVGSGFHTEFDPRFRFERLCAYAINRGPGTINTLLGCRVVDG